MIAQDVFILAMNLMDEESSDGTYSGYSDEYKKKAWPILTLLQAELLDQSITIIPVTNPTNTLQMDDRTCLTILPYGLAAHLLLSEDQSKASFFNSRYDELKGSVPSTITAVQSVYNMNDYGDITTTITTPTTDTSTYGGGEF